LCMPEALKCARLVLASALVGYRYKRPRWPDRCLRTSAEWQA